MEKEIEAIAKVIDDYGDYLLEYETISASIPLEDVLAFLSRLRDVVEPLPSPLET